jgi:glycine hydroxymethyltransferase
MFADRIGSKRRLRKRIGSGEYVYEQLRDKDSKAEAGCECWHKGIFAALRQADKRVWQLVSGEYGRRRNSIQLLAAENECSKAVLAALGSVMQNKTAEGSISDRHHGGCEVVDRIEQLAVMRAKEVFGARYANVQPHSGSQANQIVITAILQKGERILSMATEQGGHFSHGSADSFTGRFFEVENYYLDSSCQLDYDSIREKALGFRPKLLICGASAYPRAIDFARFREIADEAGAYLLADISHIAGLVSAGVHQSPIDFAHFTTTSTYKSGGPRGGLILMGRDFDKEVETGSRREALWRLIEANTFPGVQGTPYFNNIAAKAVFFNEMLSQEYKQRQERIIENAKRLSQRLLDLGYDMMTGGTDNHMVILNAARLKEGLTGRMAERILGEVGIVVDRIELSTGSGKGGGSSGVRLGTAIVTRLGMGTEQMDLIGTLIDEALRVAEAIGENEYVIDGDVRERICSRVAQLCKEYMRD